MSVEGELVDVSETLRCPVCMEIFNDPVFCGGMPCQHVFCRSCVERSLERSEQCPVCREPMLAEDLRPHQVIKNLLDEVTVRCERACGWTGRRDDLSAHMEVCPIVLMELARAKLASQSERFAGVDSQLRERDNRIAELESAVFEKDRLVVSSGQELLKLQVQISELAEKVRKSELQLENCRRQSAETAAELASIRGSSLEGYYSPQHDWASRGRAAPPPTPLPGAAALDATLEAAVSALDMPADVTRDAWLDPEGFSRMNLTTDENVDLVSPSAGLEPRVCNPDDKDLDLHL